MKPQDLAELLALAALWGASFLFMRLGAAEFGPVPLTALHDRQVAVGSAQMAYFLIKRTFEVINRQLWALLMRELISNPLICPLRSNLRHFIQSDLK